MNIINNKLLWVLFLFGLVCDFVIVYILAKFYPGYSHLKQVMSVLGNNNSPVRDIYNIWLVLFGVIVILFGISIYFQYRNSSEALAVITSVLIIIYGIGGCIISGIFSVNEVREVETIHSKIHGIGAGIGFMLLTFTPLLIGKLLIKNHDVILGHISIILFIICLGIFVMFILSEKDQFQNSIIGNSGLWQRLLLGVMYTPLILLCIKNIWRKLA